MATIGIINENGEQIERRVVSKNANLRSEAIGSFSPTLVQRIKFDNKGQMSSITTECGETENRREGNNKVNLTVEGIIVQDEIQQLRALEAREQITFVSDMYDGPVIIERLSITQDPSLIYYKENNAEEQLAFNFQLQLKEP